MLANDMYRIPNESKDAVIAMAVFDQNPESAIGDIAKEVHRVLVDGGVVIYIHNEELNLPATAASMLYSSLHPLQLRSEPRYLLPSDRWQPTNDLEYCSGHKDDIDEALGQLGEDGALLSAYIHGVHPGLTGTVQPQTSTGKVETHFIQKCTVETMRRIRQLVSTLQTECGVQLRHHATADLLADKTVRSYAHRQMDSKCSAEECSNCDAAVRGHIILNRVLSMLFSYAASPDSDMLRRAIPRRSPRLNKC